MNCCVVAYKHWSRYGDETKYFQALHWSRHVCQQAENQTKICTCPHRTSRGRVNLSGSHGEADMQIANCWVSWSWLLSQLKLIVVLVDFIEISSSSTLVVDIPGIQSRSMRHQMTAQWRRCEDNSYTFILTQARVNAATHGWCRYYLDSNVVHCVILHFKHYKDELLCWGNMISSFSWFFKAPPAIRLLSFSWIRK